MRILVLEPEDAARGEIERALRGAGHRVWGARDAREAQDVLAAVPLDLAVIAVDAGVEIVRCVPGGVHVWASTERELGEVRESARRTYDPLRRVQLWWRRPVDVAGIVRAIGWRNG